MGPRTQGNLKQTVVFDLSDSLPAIDLRGGQLHQSQEYLASQRLFQLSDEGSPPLANRPQQTLSFLPVSIRRWTRTLRTASPVLALRTGIPDQHIQTR